MGKFTKITKTCPRKTCLLDALLNSEGCKQVVRLWEKDITYYWEKMSLG